MLVQAFLGVAWVCVFASTAGAAPKPLNADANALARVLLSNPVAAKQMSDYSNSVMESSYEDLTPVSAPTGSYVSRYVIKGYLATGELMAPGATLTATETTYCTAGGDGPCHISWQTELRDNVGRLIVPAKQ